MTLSRRAILGGGAGLAFATPVAAASRDPASVGRKIARDYLGRAELMRYDSGDVHAVHYAEAATAYGAAKLGGLIQDRALVDGVATRYLRLADENIPNTANHVDANVIGVWPLELYRQTGDFDDLKQGLALADGQWTDLRDDGLTKQTRFWIDDMWMIGALQVQAFRTTRRPVYLDRAGRELAAYVTRLQQPNGLFFHGPEAPYSWGRGNGWVAAGLAEVLSELSQDHPSYTVLRNGYGRMMEALLRFQAPDGMWRQLVDRPQAWAESSCTAMFGFAMAAGVKRGLLSGRAYDDAVRNAWKALCKRLGRDGRLADICIGTGQSGEMQFYLDRPKVTGDLHGQAPMLWLACALVESA